MSRFIGDKRKVVCLIIIVCIVFLSLLGILFVGRTTAGHTACIYSNGRLIKIVELDSERKGDAADVYRIFRWRRL